MHLHRKINIILTLIIALVGGAIVVYCLTSQAPKDFPRGVLVRVEKNMGLSAIAEQLKSQNVIRSAFAFKGIVVLMGGERILAQGDFYFEEPANSFTVARRLIAKDHGLSMIKITLPEGLTIKEMGRVLTMKLPSFNTPLFIKLAQGKEGYLFPDTYLFFPNIEPKDVVAELEKNFYEKIAPLENDIKIFGKPLNDIVIMASIIEKEGKDVASKQMVSNILYKRLAIGLPLQVDAPFLYEIGKTSADLTTDDLKKDSPYNTYTRKGLPIAPISNPGIDSIKAAISPTTTPYLYYLSAKDGTFYYAKTHDEHVANKQKYLKK